MLIPLNSIKQIYDRIKDDAISPGCTISIFIANDCDALAAAKILTVRTS